MTKSKKLGDLSIKKPSSESTESVKGGKLKSGFARALPARKGRAIMGSVKSAARNARRPD